MSETINKLSDMLKEEKWTGSGIASWSISNFNILNDLLEEITENNEADEAMELTNEHLEGSKNSLIALYLSGMISLETQLVDDTSFIILINIFVKNSKWNIVKYLCDKILEFGENKQALKTLAEYYTQENDKENLYAVWERLIKIDYEEADIIKKLAIAKEEAGDIDHAVSYYKKAIYRYINKKMVGNIGEIWSKLVEYCHTDIDFFIHVANKNTKIIGAEKSIILLEELYPKFNEEEDWDTCIIILKKILILDPKYGWARKEITNCFKNKYSDNSHLDEYIRLSNLSQGWRHVHDAISDFEKHISFDAGNFVYHRTWDIGVIKNIDGDNIIIDFVKKRGHSMSLKMAVNSLTSLNKKHIWVLKGVIAKDKLKAKVKGDVKWALTTIINSFESADMKKIKAELVPSVLTPGEWTTWGAEARKTLKTDSSFGNLPDNLDKFIVRDKPISYEEKAYNKFRADSKFFNRLEVINEFLENSDPDSEFFGEMFSYFTSFLNTANVNEYVVTSYIFVNNIMKVYPFLNPGINYSFNELFDDIEKLEELFSNIKLADYKKDFLSLIRTNCEDWVDIFVNLFPYYLNKHTVEVLIHTGHKDRVISLFKDIITHHREFRESLIWLARNADEENWYEKLDISYSELLVNLIQLLRVTYRDIENKKDAANNRKYNRQILSFLFKEGRINTFIDEFDQDEVARLFSIINDVKELDPSIRLGLKDKIALKFPKMKFYGEEDVEQTFSSARGLYCLEESYAKKQKELKHILDVEIPKNSKEIGIAIEMGDLKENAEYKAGKERQENLNITIGRLKEEIGKAKIVDPDSVDSSKVSFGTSIMLHNIDSNENENYIILGTWESDPSNRIISYMSPLGAELLGHVVGDVLSFEINERMFNYRIDSIDKYNF
ncbi:transcription elongation factor GreA [Thiospirochaeta perfilievii]|uniref:Transcription elongation factor GreA n=1 Tax=Thiospirochaeta perfilievii TaxID=252967 RepID=A0A5C1QGQ7_9SPIO|nr:transcription elongation factor GreA [Thiospirochaeta perfilievii]QEN05804.1 transcription elongation factor GreA [Thiospirochaeta perfilievii]